MFFGQDVQSRSKALAYFLPRRQGAEERCARHSAHPRLANVRAQVIILVAMGCENGCLKIRLDTLRLLHNKVFLEYSGEVVTRIDTPNKVVIFTQNT